MVDRVPNDGFEKLYLAIAGIAYLSGAACAHEFPDPWPKTFRYEIWHFLLFWQRV